MRVLVGERLTRKIGTVVSNRQTQCFQVIEVAPEAIKYVAQDADGTFVDRFELRKTGKSSTYVDQAPAA